VKGLDLTAGQNPVVDANFVDEPFEVFSELTSTNLQGFGSRGNGCGNVVCGYGDTVSIKRER